MSFTSDANTIQPANSEPNKAAASSYSLQGVIATMIRNASENHRPEIDALQEIVQICEAQIKDTPHAGGTARTALHNIKTCALAAIGLSCQHA